MDFLLELSDFFDIQSVFKKCVKHLKKTKMVSDARKLWLADKLSLRIKGEIMAKIKTLDDLKELGKHEEFHKLSDPLVRELLTQLVRELLTQLESSLLFKLFYLSVLLTTFNLVNYF